MLDLMIYLQSQCEELKQEYCSGGKENQRFVVYPCDEKIAWQQIYDVAEHGNSLERKEIINQVRCNFLLSFYKQDMD